MSRRRAQEPDDVLTGWKEIARWFRKHHETVQRWEQTRGLPIYHNPRPMALIEDLKAWVRREKRKGNPT